MFENGILVQMRRLTKIKMDIYIVFLNLNEAN